MVGDSLPFREGGGGSTPPHYSPPLREGVFEQEGGSRGEHIFSKFWSSPPLRGGVMGGDNLGGQISSIFVMGSSPPQAEKLAILAPKNSFTKGKCKGGSPPLAENFGDFGSLKICLQRENAKGKPAAGGNFWRFWLSTLLPPGAGGEHRGDKTSDFFGEGGSRGDKFLRILE